MSIKSLYSRYYRFADRRSEYLEKRKTTAAELLSVYRRRGMYQSVSWTYEQQKQFDDFWMQNYGKKISNKWHKIYQSINGTFCVDYIPEMLYTTRIEYAMNDFRYANVFEDKALIETIANAIHCDVPETFFVCSKGVFFDRKRKPIPYEIVLREIKKQNHDFVVKPTVDSGSGKNIHFISVDQIDDIESILSNMGKDYIVQRVIQPDPVFSSLNPTSINTIRITTYITKDSISHVPIAFRMGGGHSKLDNIHAGGIGVGILDDGKMLSEGYFLGYGDKNVRYTEHPVTKIKFADVTLPSIEKVINAAYAAHCRIPHIGIISWDFTVNKDGEPTLIEANMRNQGIWFPQIVHGKGAFGNNTASVLSLIK